MNEDEKEELEEFFDREDAGGEEWFEELEDLL